MNNAPSTDAWLAAVVGEKSSAPAVDRGGVNRQEQEGSRTGEAGLDSKDESNSGVQTQVETVLQNESAPEGFAPPVLRRHEENDSTHDGDDKASDLHDRRDMDESKGVAGGVGSASGSVGGVSLEDVVRGRRKLDGLLDWLNEKREQWTSDPCKVGGFRRREDYAISQAEIQDRNEKRIAFSMLLSPDALGVLLDTYNLPEDR